MSKLTAEEVQEAVEFIESHEVYSELAITEEYCVLVRDSLSFSMWKVRKSVVGFFETILDILRRSR